MVEFCNSCGAIIMGKKGEDVICPNCGKSKKAKGEINLSQKVDTKENIEILNTDDTTQIHPITQVECPKCGSTEAYYWTKQTRAADEPETQFFNVWDVPINGEITDKSKLFYTQFYLPYS